MTHSHFIRKTLGIKDKNIHFEEQVTEERINDQNHLVLYGKLTYTPKACEKCGTVNHSSADIVKNGTKLSTLKLPPHQLGYGYRSFINLKIRILISFNLLNPGRKPKPLFYTKRTAKKPSRSLTLKLGKLTTPPLTV